MNDKETKEGTLRVWWIPQVPMNNPFRVVVENINEAILLLNALGNYDLYQLKNNIKPDYSNVGGLEIFENGEWLEYETKEGDTIDDIMREM